jgi:hypothetical protein
MGMFEVMVLGAQTKKMDLWGCNLARTYPFAEGLRVEES